LRKTKPFELPAAPLEGQMYELNAGLADWAFQLTRETRLADSDRLKEVRREFDGAAANRPPFVTMGDEVTGSRYWHGKLSDAWADEWMRYFSGGKGEFATTAMEDTGTLQSLRFLANAGRVDWQRIMVLRTVSNYDQQPRGLTASESLARQRIGSYSAYLPSLEAAYAVGHTVVKELIEHWAKYASDTAVAR
jgi:purine nucleoside permease